MLHFIDMFLTIISYGLSAMFSIVSLYFSGSAVFLIYEGATNDMLGACIIASILTGVFAVLFLHAAIL